VKRSLSVILSAIALVAALLAGSGHTFAWPLQQSGGAPTVVSYQGQVTVDGQPYNGTGHLKFAVVDANGTTTYWSNDGTTSDEPTQAVQLTVTNGVFSVLLGDTSLAGMAQPLAATVFGGPERYLRVWFSSDGTSFTRLTPDTRIAAVPYALRAQEAANAAQLGGQPASRYFDLAQNVTITGQPAFQGGSDTTPPFTVGSSTLVSGLNADLLDGRHASELGGGGAHYQNVIVVAQSGGDYTSIQAALNSITDASATNRYLVWVAPGVYNERVTMKEYVDIEGAGESATRITSGGGLKANTGSTVTGASNAELRDLTVQNTGGGEYPWAIAIYNPGTSPRLTRITAIASGASTNNTAMYNLNGSPEMRGVTARASGGTYSRGVQNSQASPLMMDVTATASEGTMQNDAVLNYYYSSPEMVRVTATASGGQRSCGVSNGSYSSPTMTLVTATASGGQHSRGVNNESSSSPTMTLVTASASGATDSNVGVYNNHASQTMPITSPTMRSCTCTASGGSYSYGIHNYAASATVLQCTVRSSGANNSFGIYNESYSNLSRNVVVHHSLVEGTTGSIHTWSGYTTSVAYSQLIGAVRSVGATYRCVGNIDGNYNPVTCP
jgi:hypothetical protein